MQIGTYDFINLCAVPIANCAGADQGACPCPWQKAEKNCCVVNLLRGYQPPAGLKNSHWFLGFGTTFPDKKQNNVNIEYDCILYIIYHLLMYTQHTNGSVGFGSVSAVPSLSAAELQPKWPQAWLLNCIACWWPCTSYDAPNHKPNQRKTVYCCISYIHRLASMVVWLLRRLPSRFCSVLIVSGCQESCWTGYYDSYYHTRSIIITLGHTLCCYQRVLLHLLFMLSAQHFHLTAPSLDLRKKRNLGCNVGLSKNRIL